MYKTTRRGTELVILSACDSGTGAVKIGEGVMTLRRAFRVAGAQTVLASHWPVNDKATSQLMTEFIRRWRAGESVAGGAVVPPALEGVRQPLFLGGLHAHRPVELKTRTSFTSPAEDHCLMATSNPVLRMAAGGITFGR